TPGRPALSDEIRAWDSLWPDVPPTSCTSSLRCPMMPKIDMSCGTVSLPIFSTPAPTWCLSRPCWVGIRSHSRRSGQPRTRHLRHDRGQYLERARNRVGPRPQTPNHVEDILEGALGRAGGHRFHHGRSLDP